MYARLVLFFALIILGCQEKPSITVLNESTSDLKTGELKGRMKLKQHGADTFKVDLQKKNAFVYGYADQHDVDVIVEIYGPDNRKLGSFDNPARGPENYQFTTDSAGIHSIVILPFKEQSGEYSIVVKGAELLATNPEGRAEQIIRYAFPTDEKSPGVAIGVQRDGKMIYSKGFGYADLEQNAKVTPATIFHIASVSKQFTAFAIAMLADQGKLSLDDDIRKYLPEMHDFGQPITINHLVHHTSGLRDQWSLLTMAGWRMDDVITLKQIMRLVSRQRDLNFKPGDEMLYCNTGFTLMAEIVARVTHEPFSQWCKKNIFDPLKMEHTLFYDDHERVVENRSYSYHRGSNGFQKSVLNYANAGATSLFTTVEDLSLWAINFEKMTVGNQNVMQIMTQRFVLNNGDTTDYGFGQVTEKYKGLRAWSHSGGDAGFRSFFLRFPDQHLSISVFSNFASFNPVDMSYQLADLYLEKEFLPEEKKAEPPPSTPAPQPEFDPKSVRLDEFAGKYYSPELETTYSLEVVNDTLVAHHQRHDDMKLAATKKDGFNINILGDLDFTRDKGKVTGFKASNGRVRNLVFSKE